MSIASGASTYAVGKVIARTIVPINSFPGSDGLRYSGVGDIQEQLFLTPAKPAAPAATAQPALTRTQEVERPRPSRTHRVRRGETLMALSRTYGVTVDAIRRENGIRGDRILVGQVLRIPE